MLFKGKKSKKENMGQDVLKKSAEVSSVKKEEGKLTVSENSELVLDMVKLLGVKPVKVVDCLVKKIGDKVKKGEAVAEKKGKVLKKKKEVLSPIEGVLVKLEEDSGKLYIGFDKGEKGIEKEVSGKDEKDSESKKSKEMKRKGKVILKGIFGFGQGEGKVLVFDNPLKMRDLSLDLKDAIVFTPKLLSTGVVFKANALGLKGLIVGGAGDVDYEGSFDKLKGQVELTLMVLCKNGDESKFSLVRKRKGSVVFMDGEARELVEPSGD